VRTISRGTGFWKQSYHYEKELVRPDLGMQKKGKKEGFGIFSSLKISKQVYLFLPKSDNFRHLFEGSH
jgi:hypothetical protein